MSLDIFKNAFYRFTSRVLLFKEVGSEKNLI